MDNKVIEILREELGWDVVPHTLNGLTQDISIIELGQSFTLMLYPNTLRVYSNGTYAFKPTENVRKLKSALRRLYPKHILRFSKGDVNIVAFCSLFHEDELRDTIRAVKHIITA